MNTTDTGWVERFEKFAKELMLREETVSGFDERGFAKNFIAQERELVAKEEYERGYYEGEKNEFQNQAGRTKEEYERGVAVGKRKAVDYVRAYLRANRPYKSIDDILEAALETQS